MALFQPQADGTFVVGIEPAVRAWIVEMAEALEETMGTDNPDIKRLFPTAYPHDPERDAGYQVFARGQQIERKHSAIETMRATVDSKTFTPEELSAWLGIVNDIRLVLGTRLDVSEDDRRIRRKDPNAEAHLLYRQLGLIMEYMVDAASYTLESLANLLPAVVDAQQSAVVNLFDDEPLLIAQRGGKLVGADSVKAWVRESTAWLASLDASVETTTIVSTETSVAHDAVIWINVDNHKIDLPVVVIGDRPSPDHGFTSIRVYHSTWQYADGGTEAGSGTTADPGKSEFGLSHPDIIGVPDIVRHFIHHLESAEFDAVRTMFADNAIVRPASGDRFTAKGNEASDEFLGQLFDRDRLAKIQLMGIVDDGTSVVFEYQVRSDLWLGSGVGIIEQSTDGKISAIRIAGNGRRATPNQL